MKFYHRLIIIISLFMALICPALSDSGKHINNGLHKSKSIGGKSTISGRVLNANDDPIVLIYDQFGYFESSSIVSDSFHFYNLYPGSYLICVQNDYKYIYNGNTQKIDSAKWISLTNDSSITNLEIDWNKFEDGIAIFSGTCKTDSGPLPCGIEIAISKPQDWRSKDDSKFFTDINNDGTFACTTFASCYEDYFVTYRFILDSVGNQSCLQWWNDGKTLLVDNRTIPLSRVTNKNLTVLKTGSISGTLVTDKYIKSAIVYASDKDGYIFSYCQLEINNGTSQFVLSALPDGTYYIAVEPEDQEIFYYNGALTLSSAQPVIINNGTTIHNLELKRFPGNLSKVAVNNQVQTVKGKISGNVKYFNSQQNVTSGMVELWATEPNSTSSKVYTVNIGVQGTFSLNPDTGDYFLNAKPSNADIYYTKTWYNNDLSGNIKTVIHIGENEDKKVDFFIQSGGSIGGWLLSQDNRRILEQTFNEDYSIGYVYLYDQNMAVKEKTILNQLGGFRFKSIPPGIYGLRIIPCPSLGNIAQSAGFGYSTFKNINVSSDSTSYIGGVLPVSESAFISGRIERGLQSNEIIYAYGSDSTLCSYGYAFQVGRELSPRELFMDRLPVKMYSPLDFKVGPLPAGKYALARCFQSYNISKLVWLGGDTTIAVNGNVFKINIPSKAQWFDVEKGQQINLNSKKGQFNKSEIYKYAHIESITLKNDRVIIKVFNSDNLGKKIVVSLFAINGKKVKTFDNVNSEKQINWDRKDNSGNLIGNGMYIAKLYYSGKMVHDFTFTLIR